MLLQDVTWKAPFMIDDELKPKRPKQKRRPQSPKARAKGNANLKSGDHGQGNKGGRPKHYNAENRAEYLSAVRGDLGELYEIQLQLLRKEHLTSSDKIRWQITEAMIDRVCGRAPHTFAGSIQHHTSLDGTALNIEGATMSPLLADAHAYDANEAKQLRSPMKAIDVVAEPVSEQPFIVEEQSEPEPEVEAQPTPPPFSGAPADPADADPFPGAPADFRIVQRQKQQRAAQGDANFEHMRKRQEAARLDPQRYPGGVIPMAELRSDVEEGRMTLDQGATEIVQFGRVPGGTGFRKV